MKQTFQLKNGEDFAKRTINAAFPVVALSLPENFKTHTFGISFLIKYNQGVHPRLNIHCKLMNAACCTHISIVDMPEYFHSRVPVRYFQYHFSFGPVKFPGYYQVAVPFRVDDFKFIDTLIKAPCHNGRKRKVFSIMPFIVPFHQGWQNKP